MSHDEVLESPEDDHDEKYTWDSEFQKHIMSMLLVDKQFLLQSINLVHPGYFENKAHQVACRFLFDFFNKYKTLPKKAFVIQHLKEKFKEDKALLFYMSEITALYDYFEPGLEAREFLSDKITHFAKMHSLRVAFHKCLGKLNGPEDEEKWAEIYEILRVAMNVDRNFDLGLKYFETFEERYKRMMEEDNNAEIFVTGLPTIDMNIKGGGYRKGEILSFIAASGVGKSVMLSCMAATNALLAKKVVYITLELSEDRVAERFDSILTDCSIHTLYEEKDEVFTRLRQVIEEQPEKNPIIIKHFPGKSADVNTIRAYLSQMRFEGYIPDMVIVDYIGEMKDYPGMEIHRSRELLVQELRGLANEGDKFFCGVAMQPNRGAKEAQKTGRIEEEHIGASWDQINPLDGAITLNQNEIEKTLFVGRAYVMKQRFGSSKYEIKIQFNPNTLKITEISKDTYSNLMSKHSNKASKNVDVNLVVRPFDPDEVEQDGDSSEGDEHKGSKK